jgi:hypothetical protein
MADKKAAQATDNMNTTPAAGVVELKGGDSVLMSAPLQDEVGTPDKGSQVPPMHQDKSQG